MNITKIHTLRSQPVYKKVNTKLMAVAHYSQNSKMAKDSHQNTILTSVQCSTGLMFHSCYMKHTVYTVYTFIKLLGTSHITCITLAFTIKENMYPVIIWNRAGVWTRN